MITTTLNRIRAHSPCQKGWAQLLGGLGKTAPDDEPLPYVRILEINGLRDAVWCMQAEPQHAREWRLFAVACARTIPHLMADARSTAALDVAERYARGEASDEELEAARDAADAAADAASDRPDYDPSHDAFVYAADAALATTDVVASAAAGAAASATEAADATSVGAQAELFLRIVCGVQP